MKYRAFLEVFGEEQTLGTHTFRVRQDVTIYEGPSRKRAKEAYNAATIATSLNPAVAAVGWELVDC